MNIFFFLPSSSPLENSLPVRNFRVFISIRIEAAFHARYASRIYSANSSIRGNERYGKRNTEWKREKILLSIIFLARPLSLSCSPLPEEQISYHLAPFIYIYNQMDQQLFPWGKLNISRLSPSFALRGRIPFVSQRRTSYIVSKLEFSASRLQEGRESKNVTCSTRYREISPLLKYNEARNLRIKGSCFQWRHG